MALAPKPWAVVVPVKRLAVAKTRLAVPTHERVLLALAMAEDTVRACAAASLVSQVVVVTDDPDGAVMAEAAGALVVSDEPDAGLNPALRHGAAAAGRGRDDVRIATLSSDLPAVQASDIDAILASAARHERAVVADTAGTGTVLLTAASMAAFEPKYGDNSRLAHVEAGAVDLTPLATAGLRRDVDAVADLVEAWQLGCGPATSKVVDGLGGLEWLRRH
jgi:2-phospho-L-lactate guanylyltransferase